MDMSIRQTLTILEDITTLTNERQVLTTALAIDGINEFIRYEFESASTGTEVSNSLRALMTALQHSVNGSDRGALVAEYGMTDFNKLAAFKKFVKELQKSPDVYFDLYHQSM